MGVAERIVVPDSREQLWALLFEAAEIEHNLMCCYLYAYFSLKASADEGLTADEFTAVQRWRGEILDVAIEEMSHLAMVCNILSGLGAPAHYARMNFPIPPGAHPAGVVVKLAPFNLETLDHFIYLERPDTVEIADGRGFEPTQHYVRPLQADRLMAGTMDYRTVGQLYEAINLGMARLSERLGERQLFIGEVVHQMCPEVVALPHLKVVRCLKTAREAIDAIVRQGEGADAAETRSHYQRFLAVRAELLALREARPDFVPARPAAHNPVMRRPPTPEGKIWVTLEPASSLMDVGNAMYAHSLRCLALVYAGVDRTVQRGLASASVELMRLMTPVAVHLTTLPANPDQPHCTAGLSFATLRSAATLAVGPGTLPVLVERTREIAARALAVAARDPGSAALMQATATGLETLARRLSSLSMAPATIAPAPVAASSPAATAPLPPAAAPRPANGAAPPTPVPQPDGSERIPGGAVDLIYFGKRCIHARHCVLGQPKVFKANVEGPWIDPAATSVEGLLTVAHLCPSGAIGYRRNDGGPEEAAPPINLLQLRENGPLGLRAEMLLDGEPIGMRATLCRCGASKNKPYCDGSHNEIAFQATGEPATRPTEPLLQRGGPLRIEPETNGPLVVSGNLELCCGTGRTFDRLTSVRLCRCGGSATKPYCDGSHRHNGFRS
ncbi:hypothetical protein E1B00_06735 [Arenimonas terrae]|uniref:Iron-binding zinc finger CDGSH type domain-containing protein n=1 Tax=Arenimonas terrae TaxID=2546226 RepID=A0A5C4RW15_9GAMM|nr:hypothetical protein E1B00_06735 [Arenimonas terrae]